MVTGEGVVALLIEDFALFDVGHELSVVGEVGDDFEDDLRWSWDVHVGGEFAGAGGGVILGEDDEIGGAIGFLPVLAGGGSIDGECGGGEEEKGEEEVLVGHGERLSGSHKR